MLLPTKRGTLTACRGVASYPPLETTNMKNEESRIDSQSMRMCSSKKWGRLDKPPRIYWATGLKSLGISPLKNFELQMAVFVDIKRLQ